MSHGSQDFERLVTDEYGVFLYIVECECGAKHQIRAERYRGTCPRERRGGSCTDRECHATGHDHDHLIVSYDPAKPSTECPEDFTELVTEEEGALWARSFRPPHTGVY